jgi:amino-acid N-acetyltransferase
VTEGAEPAVGAAVREDRAAIVALLRACALPTEDLATSLDHFFVARAGEELVGVIGVQPFGQRGLMRSLAVTAQQRGTGVARRLWDAALARAGQLGIRELFLLTATAEAVFAHWGFARVGRDEAPEEIRQTEEFRTLCPSTAVVMRLPL